MTLEPLLSSTALHRADCSWNTSSELSAELGGGHQVLEVAHAAPDVNVPADIANVEAALQGFLAHKKS